MNMILKIVYLLLQITIKNNVSGRNALSTEISNKPKGGGYNSILEIGAASGYNLSIYENKRRLGIEPSRVNCQSAKKLYNVDMFNGMWDEFLKSKTEEKFDLIFLSHVLEHIVNPLKFIQECSKICNDYIFIEVPCLDIKFADEPYGMFSDEHVNIFTIEGLWHLMSKAGFAPINFEMFFGLYKYSSAGYPSIMTIWKKSDINEIDEMIYNSNDCLTKYLEMSERLWEKISDKIKMIPNDEKLALWGVGNLLSKLLGNTELISKNITHVYDSDIHKHNCKVLNLSVASFDKESILSGEVEAILITTYTAQKIISKTINEMKLPCKIYKLYDI